MSKRIPVIAIVGRTNIGKSTLFNALAGKRLAVVNDSPGVTRDRHYRTIRRQGHVFTIIDTGGLVGGPDESVLNEPVRQQTELAVQTADAVICVFDGLAGVHALDKEVVDYLRRSKKPAVWVVNKCEKPETSHSATEFYGLGVDDLIFVSAAHRVRLHEIIEKLAEVLNLPRSEESEERDEDEAEEVDDSTEEFSGDEQELEEKAAKEARETPIRVAIVGKPNVGKSSLVNRILGEQRVIASEQAGTTTDAIDTELVREGQRFMLIDTAGLRKRARVDDKTVERFSNLRTLRAVALADVVVLMIDATQGAPSEQDAKIAGIVHERGKSLIVVVNKWDAVEKDHRTVKAYTDSIHQAFKFARYSPILFISALKGRRCPSVLTTAREVFLQSRQRVKTSDLNRVLKRAFAHRPPPVYRGEPVKLFFATQIGVAPPTFVLFANFPRRIDFAYERYLKNILRKEFPFEGVDIKFHIRKRTSKHDRELEGAGEDKD